jgi:hypothetical protein
MNRLRAVGTAMLSLLGATLSIEPVAAAGPSCQGALNALMDKWHAIDYPMPQKPSQARVFGKDGHEATGGQVNYMRTQIYIATQDCKAGNDASALQRVTIVQNLLDGHDGHDGHVVVDKR